MPRRGVEHHPHGALARPAVQIEGGDAVRIRLALPRGVLWAVPFRGGARLSPGDAAADAPYLLDIVDAVGLLLEQVLVQVPPQGRRGEGLVAVLAPLVLDGGGLGHRRGLRPGFVARRRLVRRVRPAVLLDVVHAGRDRGYEADEILHRKTGGRPTLGGLAATSRTVDQCIAGTSLQQAGCGLEDEQLAGCWRGERKGRGRDGRLKFCGVGVGSAKAGEERSALG